MGMAVRAHEETADTPVSWAAVLVPGVTRRDPADVEVAGRATPV